MTIRTKPVSAADSYASMEKGQLISMIHFLVKREEEPTLEARVESNLFGLYLARRRKRKSQLIMNARACSLATIGTQELLPMTIGIKNN